MCPGRRDFVVGGIAALAAAAGWTGQPQASPAPTRSGLLTGLVQDIAAARWLGELYLAAGGDPAPARSLLVEAVDTPGLRAAIRMQAEAELARGEIVLLDGWVVAKIEAQALALLAAVEA
jgi:hypothetical protein